MNKRKTNFVPITEFFNIHIYSNILKLEYVCSNKIIDNLILILKFNKILSFILDMIKIRNTILIFKKKII